VAIVFLGDNVVTSVQDFYPPVHKVGIVSFK